MKPSPKRWKDTRKINYDIDGKLSMKDAVHVGEPRHRIASASSGFTIRGPLPQPSLLQIRTICTHYEEKAGGKYASKSLAGRYLFEMSREIQQQIDHIANDSNFKLRRMQLLESLSKDWEDTFGVIGQDSALSPQQVAKQMQELKAYVKATEEKLQFIESDRANDSAKFAQTVDEHYRLSRERYHQEIDRIRKINEEDINEIEAKHKEEIRALKVTHDEEIASTIAHEMEAKSRLASTYEGELSKLSDKMLVVEQELQKRVIESEAIFSKNVKVAKFEFSEKQKLRIEVLKKQIIFLQNDNSAKQRDLDIGFQVALTSATDSLKNQVGKLTDTIISLEEDLKSLNNRNLELERLLLSFKRVATDIALSENDFDRLNQTESGCDVYVDPSSINRVKRLPTSKQSHKDVNGTLLMHTLTPLLMQQFATDTLTSQNFHKTLRM